ncbi:MAG: hypothetical protein JRN62_06145 [Nitrososphaerota archaeon]|jgi:hypothetical protein|nr:hypothetical protein [Nitrososphaerota archaeon]
MQKHVVEGETIKRLLEEETGDRYALKHASDLVHKDGPSWLVHLPLGEGKGWIDNASEKDGVLTLETSVFLDVRKRIEFDYPEQVGRKRLGKAVPNLVDKDVRHKFEKQIPGIVALLDEADRVLIDVNEKYSVSASFVGRNSGLISIELKTDPTDEELIRRSVRALMEFDERLARWLKEEYSKLVGAGPRDNL